MSTYADLIGRIQNETGRFGLEAEIRLAINDAIQLYDGRDYWFNEYIRRSVCVVDKNELGLPTDLVNLKILQLSRDLTDIEALNGDKLRKDTLLSSADKVKVRGEPQSYIVHQRTIYFDHICDEAYPVRLTGTKKRPALFNDTDSNVWTNEAEILIRQCAKKLLYIDVIKQPQKAEMAAQLEAQALESLTTETHKYKSRGSTKKRLF